MEYVTSGDGTPIACDSVGTGPNAVLIGTRAENSALARELADQFRVTSYDQRGYGDSGDNQPYAVEREIEDLEAVLRYVDGPACLYGASAGGALGLEAVAAGLAVAGLAVYEVPYGIKSAHEWLAYREELEGLLAAGRRGDAFALFMKTAGSTEDQIAQARQSAHWPACESIAHTRLYGAEVLGDDQVPVDRLPRISCRVLVVTGREDDEHMTGLPKGAFRTAAESIVACVKRSERATIDASGHDPDAAVLAATVAPFFREALAQP